MVSANPARAYEFSWLTRTLFGINRFYVRAVHELEVLSACPIPDEGAGILICNHSAGLDPMLLQAVVGRVVTWMVAREYFELLGLRQMSRRLEYIPVDRGSRDSASLKAALRALKAGKLLGVFPEGRIETSLNLLPFQPGVALMAQRANAPIYPAYISGLQRNLSIARSLLDPQHARLVFGTPIRPIADGDRLTRQLEQTLLSLYNQILAKNAPHSPSTKLARSNFFSR